MTRATSRIDLKDNLMAEQLMELFRPYSVYASQRGSTVYVDDLALEVLEQLDEECDGYCDGTNIWMGGSFYEIY